MKALHLKLRKGRWYYQRRCPIEFADVEKRRIIQIALKTSDLSVAKLRAAEISIDLDKRWKDAKQRGVSLDSTNDLERYQAAREVQVTNGFEPRHSQNFTDDELIQRLRHLLLSPPSASEQRAILGLVPQPKLTLDQAFERFWAHIEDEWMRLSHDQQRVKRNVYLKAIRNFKAQICDFPVYEIERKHAIAFRTWWLRRVADEGLKPYTGNREISSLRRMMTVNLDLDGSSETNPFSRVRLKEEAEVSRIPVTEDQIHQMIVAETMPSLHSDFMLLIRLLINTGMRPVEAIGLEVGDVVLDHEVPHIHIRRNDVRGLKTPHSERLIPLLGVSLDAARKLITQGGWGKRLGKNMYATSVINRNLKSSQIITDKRQSLYSLRHWFQDQLTKRDVVDRAQAQLMGHKFHRPKYGYGKDLSELRDIIETFAI